MFIEARIDFKKPDHDLLKRKGYSSYDLHCHSRYSDGIPRVQNMVKKAKKLNIGLAITDHNEIKGSLSALKKKEVDIIPGIETTSKEGIHTLFYFYAKKDLEGFYDKYIKPNIQNKRTTYFLKIAETDLIERSKEFNSVISCAHPYGIFWTGMVKKYHKPTMVASNLKKIDAIEVINGANLNKRNIKAVELAKEINKSITGGSDCHTLYELGNTITYSKERRSAEEFLDTIKDNKSFVMGKEFDMIRKSALHSLKIKSMKMIPFSYVKKGAGYLYRRDYGIKTAVKNNLNRIKKKKA